MTGMTSPFAFLRETQEELKKVVWPTQTEVVRLTGVVIGVSVMVGLFIGGLDFIFTKLLALIIR